MNTKLNPDLAKKRHQWQVMGGMAVYGLLLMACMYLLRHGPALGLGPKVLLALLPTLPVVWVMWSVIRFLGQTDELQRRVHLESLAIAAGVTAFLTLTYGFLEEFAGLPHIAAWWTFVVIDMVWAFTGCVLWRRYR